MPRNIVVLSDGTGNSAAKLHKTNVWRLYQALELSNANQVAYYNDGVGSSSFRPLAVIGGIFGWGLKRNVLDLYTFLCRNYRPGDKIYGFGFSRGAFTIRVLTRFVLAKGLVQDFTSSDDLRRKARFLYRDFRKTSKGPWITILARWVRDLFARSLRPTISTPTDISEIEFLGLWDTVDAYGLPIEELKAGIDRYIWPLALRDRDFCGIKKACHALSIDDQRATFHPLLWDESNQTNFPDCDHTDNERLTQVWFAGVHSNVGGGYPDDGLSHVSLDWMIKEAKKKELKFNKVVEDDIAARAAPYGRMYDSRAALRAYYRYGPRQVDRPEDKQGAKIRRPKIHESVIWRMTAGTDSYAPLILPHDLCIVSDVLSWETDAQSPADQRPARRKAERNIFSLEDYRREIEQRKKVYFASDSSLAQPNQYLIDLIWDTVWWRRMVYFATLAATAVLITYPFLPEEQFNLTPDDIRELTEGFSPIVNGIVDLLNAFLPGFASHWTEAFRTSPWNVTALVITTLALFALGSSIDRRIHDRALAAWNPEWRKTRPRWFQESVRHRWLVVGLGIVVAGLIAAYAVIQLKRPDLGLCQVILDTANRSSCELVKTVSDRAVHSVILIVAIALGIAVVIWGVGLSRMQDGVDQQVEPRGLALWLANKMRARHFKSMYEKIAPVTFAMVIILIVLVAANRISFAFLSTAGKVCVRSDNALQLAEKEIKTMPIKLNSLCNATGIELAQGVEYRVTVRSSSDWFNGDLRLRTGPAGFKTPISAPEMLLAVALRRHFADAWFVPVARVSHKGDEHYVLGANPVTIKPRRKGQLFLFVNEAVLGIPGMYDYFYQNNRGDADVVIERL